MIFNTYQIRRDNLRVLVEMGYSSDSYPLAKTMKLARPQLIDELMRTPGAVITDGLARAIERAAGWPHGWLDEFPTEARSPIELSDCDRALIELTANNAGKTREQVLGEAITQYFLMRSGP